MAVPKRKMSRARTRNRKAQWFKRATAPTTSVCPQCRQPRRPHTVCEECGTYKGRQVTEGR